MTLGGNTPPQARDTSIPHTEVEDALPLDHVLLLLNRSPAAEASLTAEIERLHDPASPDYHHWLKPADLHQQFGINAADRAAVSGWLAGHGLTINRFYENGLVVDVSGSARQIEDTFHVALARLTLPDGSRHVSNLDDPRIPAALAPLVHGIASLNDFFPRPHSVIRGPVAYDHKSGQWQPRFDVPYKKFVFHTVGPYDFDTIYDVLPLWKRGVTGTGITIAAVEDTNLAHPADWTSFRRTFGLDSFTKASFAQIYPGCSNPGQNSDEIEAALDVEWASAAAPNATIELAACPDTATTSGIDSSILGLLDYQPPDIITDSYGYCETFSGQTEVALQNREAQIATALGVTLFIAEGDVGPDQCAAGDSVNFSRYGITGGDDTATAYAVDVGGTDFMAQYNADMGGSPVGRYWSATNDPTTLLSARSYIPEIPWNDSCASRLIYSDPANGGYDQAYGPKGFCNTKVGRQYYSDAGSGGPSTCFTGVPSIPGVVSGSCKGNPKPSFQKGVPGIPEDGLRDQPDISFFAATGVWGSFLVECMSDTKQQYGAACTANNDALLLGGGGTSFAAPAMAGIQALIDQRYGDQGDANYVYYKLAARQFQSHSLTDCNASRLNGNLPDATCTFHDVTTGSISTPCGLGPKAHYYDCYGGTPGILGIQTHADGDPAQAYKAHIGYDLATGLGSVDAALLFDKWATITP